MKVINKPTKGKDEQAEAGEEMKKDIVPKKSGIQVNYIIISPHVLIGSGYYQKND